MRKPSLKTCRRTFQVFIALSFIVIPIFNREDYSYVYGNFLSFHLFGIPFADPLAVLQLSLKNFYLTLDNLIGSLLPLLLAFLLGTVFCSWICVFGLLSEVTQYISKKAMPSSYKGWPIRRKGFGYKALIFIVGILGFFIYSTTPILNQLSLAAWYSRFFQYLFGQDTLSLSFIFLFALLSIEFLAQKRLWCRYVCPQSILITLTKMMNQKRLRVVFMKEKCICKPGHERCEAACTLSLQPKKVNRVLEKECNNCGDCVVACRKMGKALFFDFPFMNGFLERTSRLIPPVRKIYISLAVFATMIVMFGSFYYLFEKFKINTNKIVINNSILTNKRISLSNSQADFFELLADGTFIVVGGDWPINGFKGWRWENIDKKGSFKIDSGGKDQESSKIYKVSDPIRVSTIVKQVSYTDGIEIKNLKNELHTVENYSEIINSHFQKSITMDARVVLTRWAEDTYVLTLTVEDYGGKKIKRIYSEGDAITTEGMLTSVNQWSNSPEIIVSSGSKPNLPIHTQMEIIFRDGHKELANFITTRINDRSTEAFSDPWF